MVLGETEETAKIGEECDRSFAASADIGYATRRARWNLGLGLRSAIAPFLAELSAGISYATERARWKLGLGLRSVIGL
jgi:hypothetical protein